MSAGAASRRTRAPRSFAAPIAFCVTLLLAAGTGSAGQEKLDACAARVRDRPDELESYMCYWFAARAGDADGATRALEALLAIDAGNHRARLYLAAIRADRGDPGAEALYREAADGFSDWGEPRGEVYALLSLCHLLNRAGRAEESNRELERLAQVAAAADNPELLARVAALRASGAMWRGAYGEALGYLREAERFAFPDGPIDLRSGVLARTGEAYWAQGLLEPAREAYARQAELMARAGDLHVAAVARLNVALLSGTLVRQGRLTADEVVGDLRQAVESARRVGNRTAEARALLQLGHWVSPAEAITAQERSLAIYREIGNRRGTRQATRDLAYAIWVAEPARRNQALRLVGDAIADARSDGDLQDLARGLLGQAAMLLEAAPREEWIEASEDALDAVERIRDLQPHGTVGARLFSRWAFAYYRYSGGLLRSLAESSDPEGDLDLAFRTIERMRARSLLDEMDGAGAYPSTRAALPEARRRAEVLEEIAQVQKRLADPKLPAPERTADLDGLERLETEEALLRDAVARADPAFAEWRMPAIPGIAATQERLTPDQAILAFQVADLYRPDPGGKFYGGAWVIAITRSAARAFPLPDEAELEDRIRIFTGLCHRRDESDQTVGERLFEQLLAEPLRWIGPEVRRLVLVPDDCLHGLPFAALRGGAGGPPLGVTHRLSRAPSVAFWMRWGKERAEAAERPGAVLAVADPDLSGAAGAAGDAGAADTAGTRAANPWYEGLRLGSLPRARREAGALLRVLGGAGHVATGPDASESLLKETDLTRFRILHLAAHAVVDEDNPDRSAVVLAPGGAQDDGFLQVREIVDLDARDSVVILSACRGLSGTVVRGSAMLGLGQGFLRAGARAVIGNLWPLRDDEAELFIGELGRSLARGNDLASAVAEARAARIDAGDPAAAWAGMVVLGDGDFVPIPGGREELLDGPLPLAIGALAVILLVATRALARRRRRRALP